MTRALLVPTDRDGEYVNLAGVSMLRVERSTRDDGSFVVLAIRGRERTVLQRGTEIECREAAAQYANWINEAARS